MLESTTVTKTGMKRISGKSVMGFILFVALVAISIQGCKSMNKTQKGAAIGVGGGAVLGGVVGRALGNTAAGVIVGAAVGGTVGAVIGRKMDKQAEEIAKTMGDAEVIREGEAIVIKFNEKVLFAYDRSDLNMTAKSNLDKLRTILLKYPETNITVIGHTDSKGSLKYNQTLSENRANSVKSYGNERGIANDRLNAIGKGENDPIATNDTEEGSALNRRVEFVITANEKMKAEAQKETAYN